MSHSRREKAGPASTLIAEPSADKVLYLLHGIFGSGRNWSSVMRRFIRQRPAWACRLIDLREHGDSQGFAPPHTIAAAARDLSELATANDEAPAAMLGHSFGGKVALTFARDHPEGLEQVWVIDSTPAARAPDGSAWQMLQLLRQLPAEFEDRDELVVRLGEAGIARPVGQWMATNLEAANGGYRWRFDLDSIEELLRDFFEQDLWPFVEQTPAQLQLHFVKAEESSVLTPAAIERLEALSTGGRVFLHRVPGGHWVNADSPDALLALMQEHL